MRSQSIDDYLKTIYLIQEEQNGEAVSTTLLAARLGVANASVTGMLKRFAAAEPKLVDYEPYNGATLTRAGQKLALEIIRHHRLIESYLNQKLGYTWDQVHEEAERLEHVISEEMETRLAIALGEPDTDPHGDPIPDREGNLHQPAYQSLKDLPQGQTGTIRRVLGQEPELLRYLTEQGLILAARIVILSKAPFDGPITVQVLDRPDSPIALGRDVAEKILVAPVSNFATEKPDEESIRSPQEKRHPA